jgi:hypothetical protein
MDKNPLGARLKTDLFCEGLGIAYVGLDIEAARIAEAVLRSR